MAFLSETSFLGLRGHRIHLAHHEADADDEEGGSELHDFTSTAQKVAL
jgi:hypothetical protein